MKKLLFAVLALSLLLSACSSAAPSETQPQSTSASASSESTSIESAAMESTFAGSAAPTSSRSTPSSQTAAERRFDLERLQALLAREGILPDEDVVAFVWELTDNYSSTLHVWGDQYLFALPDEYTAFCYPNYPAVAAALEGKLSPAAQRWLELKAEEADYIPDIIPSDDPEENAALEVPAAHRAHMEELWQAFSLEYPGFESFPYYRTQLG